MGSGLVASAVALLLAGGLAIGTTLTLVNAVNDTPQGNDATVVDYGSTSPDTSEDAAE